jgi:hypothetical protein
MTTPHRFHSKSKALAEYFNTYANAIEELQSTLSTSRLVSAEVPISVGSDLSTVQLLPPVSDGSRSGIIVVWNGQILGPANFYATTTQVEIQHPIDVFAAGDWAVVYYVPQGIIEPPAPEFQWMLRHITGLEIPAGSNDGLFHLDAPPVIVVPNTLSIVHNGLALPSSVAQIDDNLGAAYVTLQHDDVFHEGDWLEIRFQRRVTL